MRRLRPLAMVIVVAGLFILGSGLGNATGWSFSDLWTPRSMQPQGPFPVLDASRPIRITIPKIGVKAPIHGVGLDRNGTIAVPALHLRNEAGWYDDGPTPGQYGPAIIVGHVDSRERPAVFARLKDLRAGDKVEVTRRDRQVAVFEVNSVESFSKEGLPVKRVYSDFSRPALRLITCGGNWVGGEFGYADNIVVFASLISARKSG